METKADCLPCRLTQATVFTGASLYCLHVRRQLLQKGLAQPLKSPFDLVRSSTAKQPMMTLRALNREKRFLTALSVLFAGLAGWRLIG